MIVLLQSCSATWHLNNAIKKDPTILKKDTVTVVDTVVTAPVTVRDTVTLSKRDTVTITKDKITVKIVRSFDTLSIEAECASDTIVRTIEVPYEKVVYVQQQTLKDKVTAWILYIGLAFIGYKILSKYLNA